MACCFCNQLQCCCGYHTQYTLASDTLGVQRFNTGQSNYNLQALNEQFAAEYRQQLEQVAKARKEREALLDKIEASLSPAAKCADDCTPASPCYAVGVCPQWREDECNASEWADLHGDGLEEGLHSREPGLWYYPDLEKPSPPPELRCVRDWVCGLGRTSHNR